MKKLFNTKLFLTALSFCFLACNNNYKHPDNYKELISEVMLKVDAELNAHQKNNSDSRTLSYHTKREVTHLTSKFPPFKSSSDAPLHSLGRAALLLELIDRKLDKRTYYDIFQAGNFSYAYLENEDLNGAYLEGAFLSNADLRGANLSNSFMEDANLTEADLTGANLHKTNLNKGILPRAILTNTNLNKAQLNQTYLEGIDFSKTKLENVSMNNAFLGNTKLYNKKKSVAATIY